MKGILENLSEVNAKRSEDSFGISPHDWALSQWGNAIAGETGEMCNLIKKLERGDFDSNPHECVELIGKEMGDIIIYLDLLATSIGINLSEAVRQKFNETSEKRGSQTKL